MTQEELVLWGIGAFVVVLIIAVIVIMRKKRSDSIQSSPKNVNTPDIPDPPRPVYKSDDVDQEENTPDGAPDLPEEEEDTVLSTDMKAKEAIDKIRSEDYEDLKGFVPDSEERVTVLRAWQSKKEA